MPNNWVSQVMFLTQGIANITKTNDAVAGGSSSQGTGAADYGSQLGSRMILGNDEPRLPIALFGGMFQYVQFKSSVSTNSPAIGLIAFWSTDSTYIVQCDEPTGVSDIAGVVISSTSAGDYGFIQTKGKVKVTFRATVTKATPAVGDLVVCAADGSATADILADATSLTSVQARHILGIVPAQGPAPTSGSLTAIRLGMGGDRDNF